VLTVIDYDAKGGISVEERARRDRVAQDHTILFNTYTETSVSGLGRHIVIWARPVGRNLKLGVHGEIEVFQDKRYVALTGHLIGQANGVEARADELDQIIKEFGEMSVGPRPSGSLRLVGGRDVDLADLGPVSARFWGLPLENDLAAGIERTDVDELPPKKEVERWCEAIMASPIALGQLGSYDAWVNTLGFPLARVAHEQPQDEQFYRGLFLRVSAVAPSYDEAAAEAKWQDLYGVAGRDRDVKSSWPSLRHFARQHGYVDPLPPVAGVAQAPDVTSGVTAGGHVAADPLRFTSLPLKEAVARINTKFFVLRSSGKIYGHDAGGDLRALPRQDFKTALGGREAETIDETGKTKVRSAADAWLNDHQRREYCEFQYCPNNEGLKPDSLNLWTGWGDVVPAPGNCSIVTDHIFHIVSNGDQAKSTFFLNWLADILQNPTRKPGVCVVLRGRQGCGKTVVGAIARKLLGSKNVLTVHDKDRLLGRFNSSVMNKILLVGEEMLFAGDRPTTDKLKHLITGQTIPIEFKFGDTLEIESHHRLLLTSNHEQVFQAAGEERRFVIYEVSDAKVGDADYFDRLHAVADGRDNSTAPALMKFLLDRDLTGFRPWKEQQSFAADAALARQKELSLSPPLAWLREVADAVAGQGPPGDYEWQDGLPYPKGQPFGQPRESKWPPRFPRVEAVRAFRNWAAKARPYCASEYTGSEERFWTEIFKVIPRAKTTRQGTGGVRMVSIDLADLETNFATHLKGEVV
jgi:Family of unknown function (DUF5906)